MVNAFAVGDATRAFYSLSFVTPTGPTERLER